MKLKKILAALAASAMALTMFGMMASAEGVEGEEEIVDATEAPAETEAVEETEAAEEAPAANPATGNASVALAVIPVALAAAAIVAKKAK